MSFVPVSSSVYPSAAAYPYGPAGTPDDNSAQSDTPTWPTADVPASSGQHISRNAKSDAANQTILGLSPTQLLLAGVGSTAIGVAAAGTIYAGARKGGWWNKSAEETSEPNEAPAQETATADASGRPHFANDYTPSEDLPPAPDTPVEISEVGDDLSQGGGSAPGSTDAADVHPGNKPVHGAESSESEDPNLSNLSKLKKDNPSKGWRFFSFFK